MIASVDMVESFLRSIRWARVAWLGVTVFAVTVFHGAFVSYCVVPQVYYGNALVEVGSADTNVNLATEEAMIRSKLVLVPVIEALRLDKIWVKRVYKSRLDALIEEDAIAFLEKLLRVRARPGSNVITIRLASQVPQEAADVANAIADQYVYELKAMDDPREAQVFERASTPKEPTLPIHWLDLVYALIEGLVLAPPIAFLIELVIRYIYSQAARMPTSEAAPKPSDDY
jgi:capsular polysaccharide biosynthesis protein